MAIDLPPGIVYLSQRLPKLVAPPLLAYVLGILARSQTNIDIPDWAIPVAIVLSLPAALTAKVQWQLFKDRRGAARFGAVLPPAIPDQYGLPGGLGFVMNSGKEVAVGYPADTLEQICQKLGYTLNGRVFFENRIVTCDPEYIKAVLATQFNEFEKGPEQRRQLYPLLGTGVFAADGELWKFHRAMTRPFFTKDRISHFDLFDRHAGDAIQQMQARFAEGCPVDFQDVVARFTLDSATEFLLGHNVKSLSEGLPYPHSQQSGKSSSHRELATSKFIKAFSLSQDITAFRLRFGDHWPLLSFWKDELKQHMKVVHEFLDPIVAAAVRNKKESSTVTEKDEETLLENLVNSTEDPIILRDEVMNLLVAGRDTTACLLTFTLYMLAENPDVLTRLREEIMSRIGPTGKPTYDDFREMKYLRAVLNETLRLYPPVPFNIRVSKTPTILKPRVPGDKPIYVPEDVRVPYASIVMHRRQDLWGPDALNFDPDRFLDERLHKYLTPNPFIFLPFNAGPRICLGQQFAYNEASFFLVRLLQNFSSVSLALDVPKEEDKPPAEWSKSSNPLISREKVKPRSHLTLYVQGGLWVKME